ncbi:GPI-anchored protein LLG3-like [Diospyros lotus]|uniref:GPI-anchored protein LLG3-like n=1 Tax=Diospyros lotus TaxID=55363 RepID=UPI00224E31EB|nr:GPI-anchored protein LLG3-like [Diospyros lotus]
MVPQYSSSFLFLFAFLAGLASSATISNGVLQSHGMTARALLQVKSDCSIDFEHQNYTIITSQCKGPRYETTICCKAFRQFACPFTNELNDDKSNCANTMFGYINTFGKYPPGLFASLCIDTTNDKGLGCTDEQIELSNGVPSKFNQSPVLMLAAAAAAFITCCPFELF